jgi:ADP-ribose pyrophosphatase YjhB (NUDIX family)
MAKVRSAAKAIIVDGKRVLLTKNQGQREAFYLFPGGGQEHGENLIDALRRECLEEIAVRVNVGRLLFVRDYIASNHEFAAEDSGHHQLELYFECTLLPGEVPRNGAGKDVHQIDIEWVPLDALADIRLYPKILRAGWSHLIGQYLGDVN